MAALIATRKAPWAEALVLQPPAPQPSVGPTQLKLRVLAAGLAFPDVLSIEGSHVRQLEYPYVPGMEVSGEVIEVGSAVTEYSVGDRVFGAPLNGAFQPECLVQSENVHRIPSGVDPSICAGFELNYGTAYHALHDLAQLQPGERVLVLGASGGVGMAGIDLAVAAGCEVIACASSAEKLQACKEAGASVLINYETDAGGDFKQALRDAGVYPLIDVVLDPVGGKWSEVGLRSLRWGGRLVVVGFAAGGTVPKEGIAKIPLNLALLNERKILGCGTGTWQGQPMSKLMEQVATGLLRPLIKEYPLAQFATAFSDIMERRVVGKIVLRVADGPNL